MATLPFTSGLSTPGPRDTEPSVWSRMRRALASSPITRRAAALLAVNMAMLTAVCAVFVATQGATREVTEAVERRAAQVEIAHEWGRTSDQMTRAAREFTATGDVRHRAAFETMLAIREGRTRRPKPYPRTYWNLVLAGRPQNAAGRQVPLLQLAREARFAPDATALLGRAGAAGKTLVAIERDAMARGDPEALFGARHNRAKRDVSAALDRLLQQVGERSDAAVAEAQERSANLAAAMFALLCLAGVLAPLSAWSFVAGVIRPITRLSAAMDAIARAPDDPRPIPHAWRRDEIGNMARALEGFRAAALDRDRLREAEHRQLRRREEDMAAHRNALAEAAARARRAGAVEELVDRLGADLAIAMAAVADAGGELNECAQTMTLVAHGTERRMAEAEQGGRDTAAHVDMVAATCRQLARATGEIEAQTARSLESTDAAVEAVRRTGATVDALTGHGDRIGGIVALIGRIATKTNRLAINATIEAAHAGHAGKGFAVVAAEVKSLARQTAAAADQISAQLGDVRRGAHDTAAMVEAIAGSIDAMREIGLGIGEAVEQQATATANISLSADLAARRTRDCADTMAEIRTSAGHTRASIARVIGAASALTGTNDAVRTHVESFAAEVRQV